jgi:hypothetical protein
MGLINGILTTCVLIHDFSKTSAVFITVHKMFPVEMRQISFPDFASIPLVISTVFNQST